MRLVLVGAAGLATAMLAGGCAVLSHSASLTFQVDDVQCGPATAPGAIGTVCSFLAYYGNVGGKAVQVEPATTTVLDKTGRSFTPTAQAVSGGFLLKPGVQKSVNWSVTLPANTKPATVRWHGSVVQVGLLVGTAAPSAAPSASAGASASAAVSVPPSSAAASATPTPSPTPAVTTTKPRPKPSKTKAKPAKTSAKPTKTSKPTTAAPTTPPHTTPPPPPAPATTTHHVVHPPPPPVPTTTNPSNPGGGVGGIG